MMVAVLRYCPVNMVVIVTTLVRVTMVILVCYLW